MSRRTDALSAVTYGISSGACPVPFAHFAQIVLLTSVSSGPIPPPSLPRLDMSVDATSEHRQSLPSGQGFPNGQGVVRPTIKRPPCPSLSSGPPVPRPLRDATGVSVLASPRVAGCP